MPATTTVAPADFLQEQANDPVEVAGMDYAGDKAELSCLPARTKLMPLWYKSVWKPERGSILTIIRIAWGGDLRNSTHVLARYRFHICENPILIHEVATFDKGYAKSLFKINYV